MPLTVLIFGLSGSGKTTLALNLVNLLKKEKTVTWLNADVIRDKYKDWDFSLAGRERAAKRMQSLAYLDHSDIVVIDMIAPTNELRNIIGAHWNIWVDTVSCSKYKDTDLLFENPVPKPQFRVNTQESVYWSQVIAANILNSPK
jgi:adenylylsulfate kinase-like enzyme